MPGTDVFGGTTVTDPITRPYTKVVAVIPPAAGADFTITAAEGAAWRVRTVRGLFTASAAVANRGVRFVADDGTSEYFRTRATTAVAAAGAVVHAAFDGSVGAATVGDTQIVSWPADGLFLPRGHRLRSLTDLIDVADQWSAIAVLVDIFPEGSGVEWRPGPAPYASEEF